VVAGPDSGMHARVGQSAVLLLPVLCCEQRAGSEPVASNELAPAVTTGYAIYDGVDNQGAARVGNRHELHWYRRLCQEMSYQVLPVNMDLTRVSFRWV